MSSFLQLEFDGPGQIWTFQISNYLRKRGLHSCKVWLIVSHCIKVFQNLCQQTPKPLLLKTVYIFTKTSNWIWKVRITCMNGKSFSKVMESLQWCVIDNMSYLSNWCWKCLSGHMAALLRSNILCSMSGKSNIPDISASVVWKWLQSSGKNLNWMNHLNLTWNNLVTKFGFDRCNLMFLSS